MKTIINILFILTVNHTMLSQTWDTNFNETGVLTFNVGNFDNPEDIFVQNNGKIIIAGESKNRIRFGDDTVFIAQVNPNGILNSLYGNNGIIELSYSSYTHYLGSLLLDNQKFLICTRDSDTINLTKFNSDGTKDNSFGENGVLRIFETENFYSYYKIMFTEVDNKLLLTLNYEPTQASDPWKTRIYSLNYDGSIDFSFGNNGYVNIDFGYLQQLFGNPIIHNNQLLLNGSINYYPDSNSDLEYKSIICKVNLDGTIDSDFGNGGYIVNPIGGTSDLLIQPDSKIISIGSIGGNLSGTSGDIVIVRFNNDGTLDTTFSDDGYDIKSIDTYQDFAKQALLLNNGDIIIGGGFFNFGCGGSYESMLVKYNSEGMYNIDFGNNSCYAGVFDIGKSTRTDIVKKIVLIDDNNLITLNSGHLYNLHSDFGIQIQKIIIDDTLSISNFTKEDKDVMIYPNPVSNIINFNFDFRDEDKSYQIFDMKGQIIKVGSINKDNSIDIEQISEGLYVIKLKNKSIKFLKQ